jgi:hypothetical protein
MKKTFLFLLLFTGAVTAAAQSLSPTVLSSNGGSGSAGGNTLSWTMGEVLTETYSGDSVILNQGFQQGDFTITTAVNELEGLGVDVNLYPNPVQHMLTVEFTEFVDQSVQLKLMSLAGKVIMTRTFENPSARTRLNLNSVSPGTYMLEVRIEERRKVFKIVKH